MRVPFHITTTKTWDGTPSAATVNGTPRVVVSTTQDGGTLTIVLGSLTCVDLTGSDTVVFDVGLDSTREQVTVPLTYGWASAASAGTTAGVPTVVANAATKFLTADPTTGAFRAAVAPATDLGVLRLNTITADGDVDLGGHGIDGAGAVAVLGTSLPAFGLTGTLTTSGRQVLRHPGSGDAGVGLDVTAGTRHLGSDRAEIPPRGGSLSGTYALLEARRTGGSAQNGTCFLALGDEDVVLGSPGHNADGTLIYIRDTTLDPVTQRHHVASVDYGGDWHAVSDRRTKAEIRPLDADDDDALLDALAALQVCSYRRTGRSDLAARRQIGLIANDHTDTPLENLIDSDGELHGVNTTALLMHLLRGVQALARRS